MLNLKSKIFVLFFCVIFFTQDFLFAKSLKKNANSLANINKQIENTKKKNEELEKKNKKLSAEIKETQTKMVAIANNVKKYEKQLSGYNSELYSLKMKEKILNDKIKNGDEKLSQILAVFENVSMLPKGFLFFSQSKIDTIFHSSVLLKTIMEELNVAKQEYQNNLIALSKLRDEITVAKNSINKLNNQVKGEKAKIFQLIQTKKKAQKQLTSEQEKNKKELKRLVSESKTIEEFLKKAEALRKKKEAERKKQLALKSVIPTMLKKSTGSISLPIQGKITSYFGEKTSSGVKSKGIYLSSPSDSQIISPVDSDVVFAGSFYGFKNLLILHSSDDYYIIMGGMKDIFVEEGQNLLAGEPIGESGNNQFYIEVRDKENPIDPLRYFKV